MAIQKVTGEIIENNLLRNANLAVNSDLLFIDVVNDRVGINTSAPGTALHQHGSGGGQLEAANIPWQSL